MEIREHLFYGQQLIEAWVVIIYGFYSYFKSNPYIGSFTLLWPTEQVIAIHTLGVIVIHSTYAVKVLLLLLLCAPMIDRSIRCKSSATATEEDEEFRWRRSLYCQFKDRILCIILAHSSAPLASSSSSSSTTQNLSFVLLPKWRLFHLLLLLLFWIPKLSTSVNPLTRYHLPISIHVFTCARCWMVLNVKIFIDWFIGFGQQFPFQLDGVVDGLQIQLTNWQLKRRRSCCLNNAKLERIAWNYIYYQSRKGKPIVDTCD